MSNQDNQDQGQPYQRSLHVVSSNDTIKSQISALIDNEADIDDSVHLFTAIKAGNAAGESWQSYHLIGDAMRGNDVFSSGFKAQLMHKLADEPTVMAPTLLNQLAKEQAEDSSTATKVSSAWSIAASVAAIGFVGWFAMQQYGPNAQAPQQIAESLTQDYLMAHQSMAPSNSGYFVQDAAYTEPK